MLYVRVVNGEGSDAAPKPPILLIDEIVAPPALVRAELDTPPVIIRARGEPANRRFIECFTTTIRNRNTRMAYARAVKSVLRLVRRPPAKLEEIEAIRVASYIVS
jgi:hypothetical protein